jgi:hypothetical protein
VSWLKGKWLDEPQYVYRGFEIRRRNTSFYMDKSQYILMKLLLAGKNTRTQMLEYMHALKTEFFRSPPSLVGDVLHLGKNVEEYENVPQARAARVANLMWGKRYMVDDEFYLVYVESLPLNIPSNLQTPEPVIAVSDDIEYMFSRDGLKINYDRHWNFLMGALEPFLEAAGITAFQAAKTTKKMLRW